MAAADPHLFPPSARRLDARGTRTVARKPLNRSSGAKTDALIERAREEVSAVLRQLSKGRDEDALDFTQAWVRYHDRYED